MISKEDEKLIKLILDAHNGVNEKLDVPGRKDVATVQQLCINAGIDAGPIDGYYGPRTDYAADELAARLGIEGFGYNNPNGWPVGYSQVTAKFGRPGDKRNLTTIEVPYPLRIAWNTEQTTNKITCHKLVAESVLRILKKVLDHYGLEKLQKLGLDLYGGCFNDRNMRGGSRKSMHAWGIAFDWDPANNRLRWNASKASMAGKKYDFWWKCWEEEGWYSLGRQEDRDWMHVQACIF